MRDINEAIRETDGTGNNPETYRRAVDELLSRIEDCRELIDQGRYDYERAFLMAEAQAKRIRSLSNHPSPTALPVP